MIVSRNSTSQIVEVFVQDASQSKLAGLTALAYNSSGLVAYYIREGDSAWTAITLATATVGTFTSGGFKESDSTHAPGTYEIGLPNACFSSSTARRVTIYLQGATNMSPTPITIDITAVDLQNATSAGLADLDTNIASRSAPGTAQTITPADTTAATTAQTSIAAIVAGTDVVRANDYQGNHLMLAGSYTAPPTTAQIVTAIYTDLTSGSDFSTAGSIGALLKTNLDTNVASRSAPGTAQTITPADTTAATTAQTSIAAIVAGTDVVRANDYQGNHLMLAGSYTAPPTTAQIVTAMYIDLLSSSDFSTAGSVGAALKADLGAEPSITVEGSSVVASQT